MLRDVRAYVRRYVRAEATPHPRIRPSVRRRWRACVLRDMRAIDPSVGPSVEIANEQTEDRVLRHATKRADRDADSDLLFETI